MQLEVGNGFLFEGLTLWEVHQELRKLRPVLQDMANHWQVCWVLNKAIEKFDMWTWYGAEKSEAEGLIPILAALHALSLEHRAPPERRRHDCNFQCDVAVLPLADDRVFGILYSQQSDFQDTFEAQSWYRPYGYWPSGEDDPECGREEWREREAVWRQLLPEDNAVPSLNGFVASMVLPERLEPIRPDDLMEGGWMFPTFVTRVEDILHHVLFQTFLQMHELEVDSSNVVKVMMSYQSWMETPGGAFSRKMQRREIEDRLVEHVTVERLLQKFPASHASPECSASESGATPETESV